ncbi:arsenate reductase (glutaredoxin) [Thiotrichales bacterium 19S3-7]|nr:arsenate reductase (glutaredoxin) [Thiotrichales bacterium 19S3-7]MCF6800889.1 arsenate reductase (glutaredoxin) [Thiotrichales bacterium 19S3-11]
MKTILYHNPKCSKSRQALDYLTKNVSEFEVVEYLKTPPSSDEILTICQRLNITPKALIRTKEKLFSELGLSIENDLSDYQWAELLANHPALLERPIVLTADDAAIGRPLENIIDLFSISK